MSVLAVGLSHRSAPTDLLEQVSAGVGDPLKLLHEVAAGEHVAEAAVVSTCNRVEIYTNVTAFHGGHLDVTDALARVSGISLDSLQEHLYVDYDTRAVQHLFALACGLDSMLVGESQILGQLRESLKVAQAEGTVGRVLGEALRHALRVGKRARSETGIDRAGASLVSVALERAAAEVGDLTGGHALVVGAGATGGLAGASLRRIAVGSVTVVNRGDEASARLAARLGGTSRPLAELPAALAEADVVVTATASTSTLIDAATIARAMAARPDRPLAVVDLGLPRDVEPAAAKVPGVALINLDSLRAVLDGGQAEREVEAVRAIVAEEVALFLGWQRASRVAPTVVALRSQAEQLVRAELDRLTARLPGLDDDVRREIEDTVRRLAEKLIHAPTVRVKELASEAGGDLYADALRELFGLPRVLPTAVAGPDEEVTP
ncbi:MAG TPA: glutamyl-tRNA reductase [Mycobacteriales bacterium]